MQKDCLEPLLNKAKLLENKYEWLQAVEYYKKALSLALKNKNYWKMAELEEKIGNCYFRAALQAKTKKQYRTRMNQALEASNNANEFYQKINVQDKSEKIKNAKALVSLINSWLISETTKKRKMLEQWWKLENEILMIYEKSGDSLAIGRKCNDILEISTFNRFWLATNFFDFMNLVEEEIALGNKAINILSEVDNDYELARAYTWTSWYYSICWIWGVVPKNREEEFKQKSIDYIQKALLLVKKTDDPWLNGWTCNVAILYYNTFKKNLGSSLEFAQKMMYYAATTKDNRIKGVANMSLAGVYMLLADIEEDPDKQKSRLRECLESAKKGIHVLTPISYYQPMLGCVLSAIAALRKLALIETEINTKRSLLETGTKIALRTIRHTKGWKHVNILWTLNIFALVKYHLSEIELEANKKNQLLEEALIYQKKTRDYLELIIPFNFLFKGVVNIRIGLTLTALSKMEKRKEKKINLLNKAVSTIEKGFVLVNKEVNSKIERTLYNIGSLYNAFGGVLYQLFTLTKEKNLLQRAIKAYNCGKLLFEKTDQQINIAESHWHIAKIFDVLYEYIKSSSNYELASEAYNKASKKIPQLGKFCEDYSNYMRAWSQIELARYVHSTEEYDTAKDHYERAAELHNTTESWSYLTPNYFAWAKVEEAEGLSRNEQTELAKQTFHKALQQFNRAEESIEERLERISSEEEREMIQRLLQASDLRRKYCQARILIEEAKLLDREGRYLQSSQSYREASQNIYSIVEKVESEAERKELEYLGTLCRAWEKMANAEEMASSESYLEASQLFEKAKEYCYTRKASLWALGNSSFCKGLAAGVRYQKNVDVSEHARAKSLMKTAATNYLQAGFDNASEYAKASQRLLDAFLYMNNAETETDQEKRARQYQMAENVLQIAAGSFMKAKQPEKTAQVQQILDNVREEKALAVSLSQVMQAPIIASTTQSFVAPSPTSEVSVGLEQFQHANVQANLIAGMKEVKVGESFCLSVEFVNTGKEPALLTRVEDFVPLDFTLVKKPEIYRLEDTCLNMKGKQIAPLKLVEAKIVLQPSKKGVYQLNPTVHYLDEVGQNKSLQLKSVEIKVEEVILADRVSTGTKELDSLLLGGIPKEYAVVLTGPPSDERELLVRNFLEAGVKEEEISFYVTTEAVGIEDLLEKSAFYLFLCNPKPKVEVPDLPNVYKLRGKNLTNLNIALLKAYRNVAQFSGKRVVVEMVSDVLVDYGLKTTRQWITELTTDLVSKGFTTLAVLDPSMHPPDQANAIINLFDGEISLYQTEDPLECRKSIRIKKLRNQDYIKNPICLTT